MPSRRPLLEAELQLINESVHCRTRSLLICGALTGYRISELLFWKVGDLFSHGHIKDRVEVHKCFMKNKKAARSVKLHPFVKEVLTGYVSDPHDRQRYIFLSREGNNMAICADTANRNIKELCSRLGISTRIGTHSMRKTYARLLYKASSHDIVAVQHALGHSNVSTTMAYLEIEAERLDALVDGLWG